MVSYFLLIDTLIFNQHKGLTRTLKCPHCQKMFQHSGNLKTHILINHSDFMPFVCETCGHGMKTRQHLQDHMRKHTGEKPFECNECGKRLRTTEAFKNHMRTHTGERPYLCKICPKAFSQRSNLWQHKKMHMQEKAFACSICADRFMTRYHMNRHMKVHNDIDPSKQRVNRLQLHSANTFYIHLLYFYFPHEGKTKNAGKVFKV